MRKQNFKRIGRFFSSFTNRVYRAVASSPLGRAFTSYYRTDAYFQRTALMRTLRPNSNKKQGKTLRRALACAMDRSLLRRATYGALNGICCCSLRTVGSFFAVAGGYSLAISWLFSVLWRQGELNGFYLFLSLAVLVFGILLMFSENSVGYALEKGRLTGGLLYRLLGVSDDYVKRIPAQGVQMYAVAVPLGMIVGSVVALIGPMYPILAALFASIMLLLLTTPEAGVLLLLFLAPFSTLLPYGNLCLALAVVLSGLGYFFKVLRGTRAFRMEVRDFAVLAFLVLTLLSVSSAATEPLLGVLLSALMIFAYFPAVNILATPIWLHRCRVGVMLSATATALFGIVQFLIKLFGASAVLMPTLDELGASVRAGFSTNIVFAYFMVLAFPFAFYAFMHATTFSLRVAAGFSCTVILAASVLTWAQSAWLALLLEIVVLLLICRRQSFIYILFAVAAIPMVVLLLPQAYREAFFAFMGSNAPITGTVIATQLFFENGSGFFGSASGLARMLFGLGAGGIDSVGVLYHFQNASSLAGISFWWARWFESGVLGVLIPSALLFLVLQTCFSSLPKEPCTANDTVSASGISMILGMLLISFFNDVWESPTAMLLFFVLIAIVAADARNRHSAQVSSHAMMQNSFYVEMEYRAKEARAKRKYKGGGEKTYEQ